MSETSKLPMGRPPLPPGEKKVSLGIKVSPEVAEFARSMGNISRFFDKAGVRLMEQIKKIQETDG